MSYQVIARKWRPSMFSEVVGQQHVTRTLQNAIREGRVAHAYIFSGARGVGKTTTARLLAKAVNCLSPVGQNPDNQCENCVEITEGRSFDVLEIDGASNRGVEEIRNLRESVRYAPSKGKYKVYIIDEVHMLTKEAFNALLKTLEEPPAHVMFIFATTEMSRVPPTILSRCQRFDFRRIKTKEIAANLATIAKAEGLSVEDDALMLLASKADGSLRDAQSLFDQIVALCGSTVKRSAIVEALNLVDQDLYFQITDLIKNRDVSRGLKLVDEIISRGYDLREFLTGLSEHLRNLMVAKTTGSTDLIEAADVYRSRYAVESQSFSMVDLLRLQRFVGGTESALRWSSQPRYRLEADIVQLILLPKAREVGEVLQTIDELKKKGLEEGLVTEQVSPLAGTKERDFRTHASVGAERLHAEAVGAEQALDTQQLSSRWQELLGEVRARKISLWPVLENARVLSVEKGVVHLGCADDFQATMVTKNKSLIVDLFRQVFNVRMQLVAEVAGSGTGAAGAVPEGGGEIHKAPSEHPVIVAMKRELGAEPL